MTPHCKSLCIATAHSTTEACRLVQPKKKKKSAIVAHHLSALPKKKKHQKQSKSLIWLVVRDSPCFPRSPDFPQSHSAHLKRSTETNLTFCTKSGCAVRGPVTPLQCNKHFTTSPSNCIEANKQFASLVQTEEVLGALKHFQPRTMEDLAMQFACDGKDHVPQSSALC